MLAFALGFALTTAQAAPFLMSDAYLPDKPQPDTFLVSVGTAAPIASPAHRNPDGSVVLKWDVGGLGIGLKSFKVRAKNAWGESADIPFTFTAGAPGVVSGLRLVAGDSGSAP